MDMEVSTIRILNMAATNARLQLTDAGNLSVDGSVGGAAASFTSLSLTLPITQTPNAGDPTYNTEIKTEYNGADSFRLKVAGATYLRVNTNDGVLLAPSGLAVTGAISASSTGLVTGTFGVGAAPVSEKMRVQAAAGYNFVVDSASSSLRVSAVNDADSLNVPFIIQGSTVTLQSGNVGIGAAPSTWTAFEPLLQLKNISIGGTGTTNARFMSNIYYNSGWKYYGNGAGAHYEMDGYHAWSTVASGTAGNAATLVERMRIDSNGHVGIGTGSPSSLLDIESSAATAEISLNQTGASGRDFRLGSTGSGYGTAGLFIIYDVTASAERFRINSAGALKLSAYGAGTLTTDGSGNITAVSDQRIKKNIRPFSRGLAEILAINPILHGYSTESGLDQSRDDYAGFSAQQVQPLIPEAIGVNGDGMLSFSDRPVMAALVNAVKELSARLAALEAK